VRQVILATVLAFIALLLALTVSVVARQGPDVLTLASVLVLAMFGFGIVGALLNRPDE
jgi:hypothetical protein